MKRLLTVTGFAAVFAVGLAAQQTTTGTSGTTSSQGTQTATAGGQRGPRTITGCLRAGDTAGTYMLTNIEGMGGRNGGAAGTTAGSTGTTAGATTSGTTAGGATTSGAAGTQARGGMNSIMLSADSSADLKAHVGHKVEVTGTIAGGGRRGGDTTSGSTAGGTTTGTAGAGATTTGGGMAGTQGGARGTRSMTVTSVKMVSDSCS